VILVGNGGAEKGHNAITQYLVHRAFVAVHGVHHEVNRRVQQVLGGFRVKALDELGGILDIGKEHGDLFAFAFQARPGVEDFFGEIGRGIGQGSRRRRGGR
jgi:hypothetical protein